MREAQPKEYIHWKLDKPGQNEAVVSDQQWDLRLVIVAIRAGSFQY